MAWLLNSAAEHAAAARGPRLRRRGGLRRPRHPPRPAVDPRIVFTAWRDKTTRVVGGEAADARLGAQRAPQARSMVLELPRIQYYTDGRHPLIYMYEPPMQPEEMAHVVDEVAGTPVQALHFCLGDGRTVLHDSETTELWGDNVEAWPHVIFHRAYRNAQQLIERGHDPLRVVCDRGLEMGVQVVPAVLMNQGRGPQAGADLDVRCSTWRFEHPELEINAAGDLPAHFPGLTCLDFKHEEVRTERRALSACRHR